MECIQKMNRGEKVDPKDDVLPDSDRCVDGFPSSIAMSMTKRTDQLINEQSHKNQDKMAVLW